MVGAPPKKPFDVHVHFVTDRDTASRFAKRCGELGISVSHAGRDALALWLKHASESRAVRAYVAERRRRLTLETPPSASRARKVRP